MRYAWRSLVVRDPDLSDATRRVLLELESYADADGQNARPGQRRIAECLRTKGGEHVSERTVRRCLNIGVDRGFIECVSKGHNGRNRNSADVYRLTFPPEFVGDNSVEEGRSPDTQMSGDRPTTTGHLDVRQSDATTGHFETTTGHLDATTGHPDVRLPVPYTSPSTPDNSSLTFSNACASERGEKGNTENFSAETERTSIGFAALFPEQEPPNNVVQIRQPTAPPTAGPRAELNPLAWIDRELPGGFRIGERETAKAALDAGKHHATIRFQILKARNSRTSRPLGRTRPVVDNAKKDA